MRLQGGWGHLPSTARHLDRWMQLVWCQHQYTSSAVWEAIFLGMFQLGVPQLWMHSVRTSLWYCCEQELDTWVLVLLPWICMGLLCAWKWPWIRMPLWHLWRCLQARLSGCDLVPSVLRMWGGPTEQSEFSRNWEWQWCGHCCGSSSFHHFSPGVPGHLGHLLGQEGQERAPRQPALQQPFLERWCGGRCCSPRSRWSRP